MQDNDNQFGRNEAADHILADKKFDPDREKLTKQKVKEKDTVGGAPLDVNGAENFVQYRTKEQDTNVNNQPKMGNLLEIEAMQRVNKISRGEFENITVNDLYTIIDNYGSRPFTSYFKSQDEERPTQEIEKDNHALRKLLWNNLKVIDPLNSIDQSLALAALVCRDQPRWNIFAPLAQFLVNVARVIFNTSLSFLPLFLPTIQHFLVVG